jgi:preprotein translocase subunit SecA
MVAFFIDEFKETLRRDTNAAVKNVAENLKIKFGYALKIEDAEMKNPELLEKRILEELNRDMEEKEEILGRDYLNLIIREQYLMMVDRKWLDHLENMEALREAVYLRSYAQKNPLTEYKVEGFQIFESMIDDIRQAIASRLHLVKIRTGENREQRPRTAASVQSASHSSVGAFGVSAFSAPAGRSGGGGARPEGGNVTMVRSQPKVGRNDPCPCGSGKKYKHCHGR